MDEVLGRFKSQTALVYIDDIIIYSKDVSTHIKDVDTIEQLAKSTDGLDGMNNAGTAESCVRSLFSASYASCLTAPIVQVTNHDVDMAIKDLRDALHQAPSGCSLTIDNTDSNNTNPLLTVDSDGDDDDETVQSSDTEDGEISDDNEEEEKDLEPEDIVRLYWHRGDIKYSYVQPSRVFHAHLVDPSLLASPTTVSSTS
jgi:hypothetical protein